MGSKSLGSQFTSFYSQPTGTPEAVRFLKEQILKNDMSTLEVVVILHQLPNNLIVPSQQVLEELLELVQSQTFQESKLLR